MRCGVGVLRAMPIVLGGGACCAVSGGLRSGASLVDVRFDVLPLQPSSCSQTVAGVWLGGFPAGRDLWEKILFRNGNLTLALAGWWWRQ